MMSWRRFAIALLLALVPLTAGAQTSEETYGPLAKGTPGTECAEMGFTHHFLWHGECRYNYAHRSTSLSQSSQLRLVVPALKRTVAIPVNQATDGAANTIIHTLQDAAPWWEIDLGERVWVEELVILNRTDCCGERLNGAIVAFSETVSGHALMGDRSAAVKRFSIPTAGAAVSIKPGVYAQHIRIFIPRKEWLHVAEVAVLSTPCNCPNRWRQLPGKAQDVAVSNHAFVTGRDEASVYIWDKAVSNWKRFTDGGLRRIALNENHVPWGIAKDGSLWSVTPRFDDPLRWPSSWPWQRLAGTRVGEVTMGFNNQRLAIIAPGAQQALHAWDSGRQAWVSWTAPDFLVHVAGNRQKNELWGVDAGNKIWRGVPRGGREVDWVNVPGQAFEIGVSGDQVWILGLDSRPYAWTGTTWQKMPEPRHGAAAVYTGATIVRGKIALVDDRESRLGARIDVSVTGDPWLVARDGSIWVWCERNDTINAVGELCR